MKQLTSELKAVETGKCEILAGPWYSLLRIVYTGHHELFHSSIIDLENTRRETIHNARLMMIYQISSVDKQCELNSKKVHEECVLERKEIQNALFSIIEEKRRKLKQDKDGEGDPNNSSNHQTRNRKRLTRKRGDLDGYHANVPLTANQKRKQDHILFFIYVILSVCVRSIRLTYSLTPNSTPERESKPFSRIVIACWRRRYRGRLLRNDSKKVTLHRIYIVSSFLYLSFFFRPISFFNFFTLQPSYHDY